MLRSATTRPPATTAQAYDTDADDDMREDYTPINERTSLLPKARSAYYHNGSIVQEIVIQLKSAIPIILAYTLQNSLQTVSVLIVGRLSPKALATSAFAYMFAMASGWLLGLGGTTAIDTLASASFTGSSDPHNLGIILQRALLVLTLFYVPVLAVWLASEPLFIMLGQEEWLAREASRFLWVLAPGGLGYIFFESMKKFLQAQGAI